MKKLVIAFILFSTLLAAQAPNKMSFQTVVRNNLGKLIVNKNIGVRLSILKSSSTGTAVYVETHSKTSNVNGLLTLEVGTGTTITGTFSSIDWAQGPYFLKTEMDVNGGTNYTITGVTEFVSVPYALNAAVADSIKMLNKGKNVGDMNYWNGTTWVPLNAGAEGQTLTFCDGKPTWRIGGVCPGTISTLNCASVTQIGILYASLAASGVSSVISYNGGNGGPHSGQVVTSTGVTGLTATLQAGNFSNGTGNLTYTIKGTPSNSGIAIFALNISGKNCSLNIPIQLGINFTSIGTPVGSFQNNISDIDGNIYKTVKIGTQVWMAENLKTAKYSDGTVIPNITDNTIWVNKKTGAWSYYNNDSTNNSKYGKLYNWYAISQTTNGNKNVCPTGWHVPTDAEWTILTDYLGGVSISGGKMKEVGTTNWDSPNTESTNISLFTGLPGGYRYNFGSFEYKGSYGFWWSSTEERGTEIAWERETNSFDKKIAKGNGDKFGGFSIRCLKD